MRSCGVRRSRFERWARFIAGAKQRGLPLEEIRELTAVWDAGTCAPVQDRLRTLLDEKIIEVRRRIEELTAFCGQLASARHALGRHTPDGPCDDGCGCVAPSGGDPRVPKPLNLLPACPAAATRR